MRIEIDLERCILAGECIYNHPDLFEWNPQDQPVALRPEVDDETDMRAVRQAASVCPSGAISCHE
ncbi:MAG: ferredoxin [Acidimicrobiales bacterium]